MKKFAWRLQRVLGIKIAEEKVKRVELVRTTEKLAQTRIRLLLEKRLLMDMMADIAVKEPKQRISEQEMFMKYSAATDERIRELTEKTKNLEEEQKKKINEVIQARKFREGLEKLKEKARAEFISSNEKAEIKHADDLSTIRFARKMMV